MNLALHKKLTVEAVGEVFPFLKKGEVKRVIRGNLLVDITSILHYSRASHFDRVPFGSHADAWRLGMQKLREYELRIALFSAEGKKKRVLKELGALLHTLQDLYSHSNFIELSEEQRDLFEQYVRERKESPPSVRICSYPGPLRFELKSDEFSHREYAKEDGIDERLVKAARSASTAALSRMKKNVIESMRLKSKKLTKI